MLSDFPKNKAISSFSDVKHGKAAHFKVLLTGQDNGANCNKK
jgi:hypothetical protein